MRRILATPGPALFGSSIALFLAVAAVLALWPVANSSQTYSLGQPVVTSAEWTALHYEWCPGVAVTALSTANQLAPRRAVTVENRSTATCYVTFDAQNPTTNGSLGERFLPGEFRAYDLGYGFTVQGACTAATTTGACLHVSQYR